MTDQVPPATDETLDRLDAEYAADGDDLLLLLRNTWPAVRERLRRAEYNDTMLRLRLGAFETNNEDLRAALAERQPKLVEDHPSVKLRLCSIPLHSLLSLY